ncbi:hypothetical protein Pelo_17463 [Pelomyxa schiedti]|nr:hypothetical protein Pelo_17463 [Pelomyxa schiedti]
MLNYFALSPNCRSRRLALPETVGDLMFSDASPLSRGLANISQPCVHYCSVMPAYITYINYYKCLITERGVNWEDAVWS